MELPTTIIYPYVRPDGYIYIHLPARLTKECGIASGIRFAAFVRDGKVVIEQAEQRGK